MNKIDTFWLNVINCVIFILYSLANPETPRTDLLLMFIWFNLAKIGCVYEKELLKNKHKNIVEIKHSKLKLEDDYDE